MSQEHNITYRFNNLDVLMQYLFEVDKIAERNPEYIHTYKCYVCSKEFIVRHNFKLIKNV